MNGTTKEQFEVIRRIIDRLASHGLSTSQGVVCDLADHLRTEVGYLREYVEEQQNNIPRAGDDNL